MSVLKIGYIGLGTRGRSMMKCLLNVPEVEVTYICDVHDAPIEKTLDIFKEMNIKLPKVTKNHREVLEAEDVEAVLVMTNWETHLEIGMEAMRAGKPVGVEVGGAYSLEQCFELVRTYEQTGIHCMLLENCCYGKRELTVLKMIREGLFGEVVHCSGGYFHNLADELTYGGLGLSETFGVGLAHYRMQNYISRNCDNYPTHEIGPIAKVLNINRGNRFLKLTSTASKSVGLKTYVKDHIDDLKALENVEWNQGDVVTTVITCANGETVTITLDTCLPRHYSRGFTVRGTKASYFEDLMAFFIENDPEANREWRPDKLFNNERKYLEQHMPEIWKKYGKKAESLGHGGIDYMVLSAFVECVKNKITPYIDTYDTAAWMSISALTEESIACGGAPVMFPDFTKGKWKNYRKPEANPDLEFALD